MIFSWFVVSAVVVALAVTEEVERNVNIFVNEDEAINVGNLEPVIDNGGGNGGFNFGKGINRARKVASYVVKGERARLGNILSEVGSEIERWRHTTPAPVPETRLQELVEKIQASRFAGLADDLASRIRGSDEPVTLISRIEAGLEAARANPRLAVEEVLQYLNPTPAPEPSRLQRLLNKLEGSRFSGLLEDAEERILSSPNPEAVIAKLEDLLETARDSDDPKSLLEKVFERFRPSPPSPEPSRLQRLLNRLDGSRFSGLLEDAEERILSSSNPEAVIAELKVLLETVRDSDDPKSLLEKVFEHFRPAPPSPEPSRLQRLLAKIEGSSRGSAVLSAIADKIRSSADPEAIIDDLEVVLGTVRDSDNPAALRAAVKEAIRSYFKPPTNPTLREKVISAVEGSGRLPELVDILGGHPGPVDKLEALIESARGDSPRAVADVVEAAVKAHFFNPTPAPSPSRLQRLLAAVEGSSKGSFILGELEDKIRESANPEWVVGELESLIEAAIQSGNPEAVEDAIKAFFAPDPQPGPTPRERVLAKISSSPKLSALAGLAVDRILSSDEPLALISELEGLRGNPSQIRSLIEKFLVPNPPPVPGPYMRAFWELRDNPKVIAALQDLKGRVPDPYLFKGEIEDLADFYFASDNKQLIRQAIKDRFRPSPPSRKERLIAAAESRFPGLSWSDASSAYERHRLNPLPLPTPPAPAPAPEPSELEVLIGKARARITPPEKQELEDLLEEAEDRVKDSGNAAAVEAKLEGLLERAKESDDLFEELKDVRDAIEARRNPKPKQGGLRHRLYRAGGNIISNLIPV